MEKIKYTRLKPSEDSYMVLSKLNEDARKEMLLNGLTHSEREKLKSRTFNQVFSYIRNKFKKGIKNNKPIYFKREVISQWIFDPANREDFFKENTIIYVAYVKNEKKAHIIGYMAWSYAINVKEYCIAAQLYVIPEYRRKGVSVNLIKTHLPKIHGILADGANPIARKMYNKYFNGKVVFGNQINYVWRPENLIEFQKQERLFAELLEDS